MPKILLVEDDEQLARFLQCGNVTIDPIKGIVRKNSSELAMSALEYRLLLVFFSNKNQMLSRDRLAEELWSLTKEIVSDNTLSVNIRRLREKIEDAPQRHGPAYRQIISIQIHNRYKPEKALDKSA